MKILLDENVNSQLPLLLHHLQRRGYDVIAQWINAPGASDLQVLAFATQQERTIISFDGDFAAHRFRDNLFIPYGVVFLEESKYKVRPDDALTTRKIVSAIDNIATLAVSDPNILCDTIFTFTQPTPYGLMTIRPKRYKHQKEIITNFMYVEEQNFVDSSATFTLIYRAD